MAFIIKLLCAKSVNGANQTLYSVTSPKSAIVSNVRFVNALGSAVTVNVYFHRGANQYRINQKDYSLPAGEILTIRPQLTLAAGDYIECSTNYAVDAVVCGVERE